MGAFWLLSFIDGKILGYAYAHRFKERYAYAWSAELKNAGFKSFKSCKCYDVKPVQAKSVQDLYKNELDRVFNSYIS